MNPENKLPLIIGTTLLGAFAAWWVAKALDASEDERVDEEDSAELFAKTPSGSYYEIPLARLVFRPKDGGEEEDLGEFVEDDDAYNAAFDHAAARGEEIE